MAGTHDIFKGYYDPTTIMSYTDRPWKFILGSRSIGKTTNLLVYYVLAHRKAFVAGNDELPAIVYMRRTNLEVNLVKDSVFTGVVYILQNFGIPVEDIKFVGGHYWIRYKDDPVTDSDNRHLNGYLMLGTPVALSTSEQSKSNPFLYYHTYVKDVIWDEFISVDPNRYLGKQGDNSKEYKFAYDFYTTINRRPGKPFLDGTDAVRFSFVANLASLNNPILQAYEFDRYFSRDARIIAPKGEAWVAQMCRGDDYEATKSAKETLAYKLATHEEKRYTFDNIAFDDSNNFVQSHEKEPKVIMFNVVYKGHKMGIYRLKDNTVYISEHAYPQGVTVALTMDSHDGKLDYMLVNSAHSMFIGIKNAVTYGRCSFQNQRIKRDILTFLMFV